MTQPSLDPATPNRTPPRDRGNFTGPIVGPDQLDEASEAELLQQSGGTGVLAAYRGFDPERPVVVLVYGAQGAPDDMRDIADALDQRGMQVMFFAYDDRGTRTHTSGDQLASQLENLRAQYGDNASVDIVAHSMGGHVSRSALNTLQQPGWYEGRTIGGANPRAGFDHVRLRTLDTAWTGYNHEPGLLAPDMMSGITVGIMDAAGLAGAVDMRSNSRMFERLYGPLDGVDIQNTSAHNVPGIHAPDSHRSIHDTNAEQRRQLVDWMQTGAPPQDEAARNLAGGLAQDSRFGDLHAEVRSALSSGELSPTGDPGDLVTCLMDSLQNFVLLGTSEAGA